MLPDALAEPPAGAPREEGILSLVVQEPGDRVRRLPSLYFGRAQVFAHRAVDEVLRHLARLASAITQISERPTYLVQACELDGIRGLYLRDLFNRSAFRRKLMRLGLAFVDDPVVTRAGPGFACTRWGPFQPSFAVVYTGDEAIDLSPSTARLTAMMATFHLGGLGTAEFRALLRACRGIRAIGGEDASAVVERVRSSASLN